MKTVYFILGMHRSGTSAISGELHQQGMPFGGNLIGSNKSNEKGHFENIAVQEFNQLELLPKLDSNWNMSKMLPKCWEKNNSFLDKAYCHATTIIKDEFFTYNEFAIKEPRLCILFPFWEKVMNSLNIDIKVIHIVRNPNEVIASLIKRNNFTEEHSLALWLKYNILAELYSRPYKRAVINFDSLINKPLDTLQKTLRDIEFNLPKPNTNQISVKHIQSIFRHHNNNRQLEIKAPSWIQKACATYILYSKGQKIKEGKFNKIKNKYLAYSDLFSDINVNKKMLETRNNQILIMQKRIKDLRKMVINKDKIINKQKNKLN